MSARSGAWGVGIRRCDSGDHHALRVPLHVRNVEADQFGATQSTGEADQDQGAVADGGEVSAQPSSLSSVHWTTLDTGQKTADSAGVRHMVR